MRDLDTLLVLLATAGVSSDGKKILESRSYFQLLHHGGLPRLVEAAIRNKVFYPTYVSLQELEPKLAGAKSETFLEPYSDLYHQYAVANTLWLNESYRMLGLLADAGIDVMPLKGLHLAHKYYPTSMARYAHDIDLLFKSTRERKNAERLLVQDGFSVEYSAPLETNLKKRYSRFSVHCETHISPASLAYFFEFPRWPNIWADGVAGSLAGFRVCLPRPEDLLSILCVDMAWKGYFSVCDLLDLRQIIRMNEAFHWETLETLAVTKTWRYLLSIPLLLADQLCREELDENLVPSDVLAKITEPPMSPRITYGSKNHRRTSFAQLPVEYERLFHRTDFSGTPMFTDSFLWSTSGEPTSWKRLVRTFLEAMEIPTVVRRDYGGAYAASCVRLFLSGLHSRLVG